MSANADYQSIIERLTIIIINPDRFDVDVELPAFQGAKVRPGQRAFTQILHLMSQAQFLARY